MGTIFYDQLIRSNLPEKGKLREKRLQTEDRISRDCPEYFNSFEFISYRTYIPKTKGEGKSLPYKCHKE